MEVKDLLAPDLATFLISLVFDLNLRLTIKGDIRQQLARLTAKIKQTMPAFSNFPVGATRGAFFLGFQTTICAAATVKIIINWLTQLFTSVFWPVDNLAGLTRCKSPAHFVRRF